MAELRTANSTLQKEFRQKVEQMTMNNIEIKALKSERGKMVQVQSILQRFVTLRRRILHVTLKPNV